MSNKRRFQMTKATELSKKKELSETEVKAMLANFSNKISGLLEKAFASFGKTTIEKLEDLKASLKNLNGSLETANKTMKEGK